MDFVLFITGISSLIINVKGQSCYYDYHHCTGYDWCCPDSYVCTGSSTCLSIRAIVGICIGGLFGLAIFISCIYFSCKKQKGRVGTVLTHPDVNTTVVGQHQYGEQAYGQPPAYDQTQYSQPSSFAQPGPDPAYPPTEP
ncbi:uncharacterized protein [Mytilus edulis]|uniref:uncharacterized protein n=1 Tax=Mytilus edulis TaxID=6550 RepID=UPI0039F0C7C1